MWSGALARLRLGTLLASRGADAEAAQVLDTFDGSPALHDYMFRPWAHL